MYTDESRGAPHPGDVVIGRDNDQTNRFVLGSFEHRKELICASRIAAIEHATRYASYRGVSVWQVDQQARFTLIFAPWRPFGSNPAVSAAGISRR